MSAWMARQWQAQRERIAVGVLIAGVIVNVALLGAVGVGILYEVGRGLGMAYTHPG